jgi:hypothetical protein
VRYLLLRFEVEMPWKFHQESPWTSPLNPMKSL